MSGQDGRGTATTFHPIVPVEGDPIPFSMSRIGRHSLIYGIGIVASKGVAFFMLPLYTRYLTPSDYGVLQLITMTLEVVSIFAGARIGQGIFHFYHKAGSEPDRREVMFTALVLLTTTYVVTALAMFFCAPLIADIVFEARGQYVLFVRIAAVTFSFQALLLVPMAYLRLRDRSTTFVAVALAKLVLQGTLNVILLIPLEMDVLGVLLGSLISHVLLGLVLAIYLIRDIGTRVSVSAARDFVRFGLPLVGMQVASVTLAFGDRYFLSKAGSMEAVGLYGLAFQFGLILLTVGYMPFARIWEPIRFEIARRPDPDPVYARVFIYVNLCLITLALALALFGGEFLRFVSHPAFHSAAPLIPAMLLATILQAWMAFLNIGVFLKERTEFFTLATWVAAVVGVLGYVLLIPRLLAWGAVISLIAANGIRLYIVYAFAQRLWPIQYRWGPVLRLLAAAILVYIVAALVPATSVAVSVGGRVLLLFLYVGLIWSWDILSESERSSLVRLARRPRAAFARLVG